MEKLAIQELLACYAHAIDDLKPDAWVQWSYPYWYPIRSLVSAVVVGVIFNHKFFWPPFTV